MSGAPVQAYLGLGSNLAEPRRQVETALAEIAGLPGTRLLARSRLYLSPPMGPPDQPDYVNAVARVATDLAPRALLDALHGIEAAHGRTRHRHWGPRTLDLDLLLYGDWISADPRLCVPHPGIALRPFVVLPLAEVAPAGLILPGLGPIEGLVQALPPGGLRPLP